MKYIRKTKCAICLGDVIFDSATRRLSCENSPRHNPCLPVQISGRRSGSPEFMEQYVPMEEAESLRGDVYR